MGSPSELLDELARVYARAAVDEFLNLMIAERNAKGSSGNVDYQTESAGCKIAEEQSRVPSGRKP
jgi:hypothetical protein